MSSAPSWTVVCFMALTTLRRLGRFSHHRLGHGVHLVGVAVALRDHVRGVDDRARRAHLPRIGIGRHLRDPVGLVDLLHALFEPRQVEHPHIARTRKVHDGACGNGGAERERLRMPILQQADRVGIAGLEVDLDIVVAEACHLQRLLRDDLGRVAARLHGHGLALQVGHGLDVAVGEHDHLEPLAIERRDVADVRHLAGEGRAASDAVDRGYRVAEADAGLVFRDGAHVDDAGAGHDLERSAGQRLLEDVLERTAERDPGTALRAGHETERLGLRRHGQRRCHKSDKDG